MIPNNNLVFSGADKSEPFSNEKRNTYDRGSVEMISVWVLQADNSAIKPLDREICDYFNFDYAMGFNYFDQRMTQERTQL